MSYKVEKTPYFTRIWQKQGTAVQGTWAWGNDVTQTDYASVTGEAKGFYYNTSNTNSDEYKWSNIYLTKGTYKITTIYVKTATRAIAEILFGTTSLGTQDMYAAVAAYNQTWTITFTLQSDQTADLRFKVTNRNASATGYYINFSRFILEKTG